MLLNPITESGNYPYKKLPSLEEKKGLFQIIYIFKTLEEMKFSNPPYDESCLTPEEKTKLDKIITAMKQIASNRGGQYMIRAFPDCCCYEISIMVPFLFTAEEAGEDGISFDDLRPLLQCCSIDFIPVDHQRLLIPASFRTQTPPPAPTTPRRK